MRALSYNRVSCKLFIFNKPNRVNFRKTYPFLNKFLSFSEKTKLVIFNKNLKWNIFQRFNFIAGIFFVGPKNKISLCEMACFEVILLVPGYLLRHCFQTNITDTTIEKLLKPKFK